MWSINDLTAAVRNAFFFLLFSKRKTILLIQQKGGPPAERFFEDCVPPHRQDIRFPFLHLLFFFLQSGWLALRTVGQLEVPASTTVIFFFFLPQKTRPLLFLRNSLNPLTFDLMMVYCDVFCVFQWAPITILPSLVWTSLPPPLSIQCGRVVHLPKLVFWVSARKLVFSLVSLVCTRLIGKCLQNVLISTRHDE